MELIHIILLALVQGLTEFLPISSSAHLILTPHLFGFQDQGLAFDVAVHLGSLLAVISYFRWQLIAMGRDFVLSLLPKGTATTNSRLAWAVILGTIPVGLAGLLFKDLIETELRSPWVIAIATIGFGLLLWWADSQAKRQRDESSLSWRDILIIGVFQAIALIPGTSRSGITMTAGLLLGLTREAASRFSFLLAIPTITLSGGLMTLDLIESKTPVDWQALLLGIALSWLAAYLCIRYFLRLIERIGMQPFVFYRLALGFVILWLLI